jgi:hypothetical protein
VTPTHAPRTHTTIDPERCAASNQREHDAIAGLIGEVATRLDGHDQLLGRDGSELKQLVQDAVAQAIGQVASDPKFWAAIRLAMLTQTKEAAGGWLLDGLGGIGKKIFWIGIIGLGLYLVGGWALLLKVAKGIGAP